MARFRIIGAVQSVGCLFLAAILLASCGTRPGPIRKKPRMGSRPSTPKDSMAIPSGPLVEALAEFNRGAALLEQYKYSDAAEAFEAALDVVPDWDAARFNLGLAYLNMQEKPGAEDYLAEARKAFEAVLQGDPDHLHARFCLGLYHQHLGQIEESLECFRAVHEGDGNDPYVAYKYAEALINLGRTEEGMRMLEEVIRLDPGFVSAVYRLATQYQRARQRDKAMPFFERFRELNKAELTGGSFAVLKVYGTVGKYYMALGADSLAVPSKETAPRTRILFSPELIHLDAEIPNWKSSGGATAVPGIATGDVDGDGDLDLCLAALGTDGTTSIWLNDGAGGFSRAATVARQGLSPCFGDLDNDSDVDLWLGRAGPDIFFENDGKGGFTKAEPNDIAGGTGITRCARLLDIDSDGDLDFLAFRLAQGSAASLFNNNGDGTFTDIAEKLGLELRNRSVAAAVHDDFDNDRDLDLALFGRSGGAVLWVNDRVWKYRLLDAEVTGLTARRVRGASSGDPDKDGDRDLLVFSDDGLQLFVNQGGLRFARHQGFADSCGRLGGTGGQFADMDNDGDLDIVIADAVRPRGGRGPALLINDWPRDGFIDTVQVDPGNLFAALKTKGDASCIVADFTGNGNCDVLLAPVGERPYLVRNVTAGGHWIQIDLLGTRGRDRKSRSNNSAIGARVEVKAGPISQQYVVGLPSGQNAMPAYRIHTGLGPYTQVDWLRIIWPDAVLQAELELAADQVLTITELPRKTSSCPHLFAWDGTHFEFVSDFGGMGGIGYLVSPGVYAKPDPTEYVLVPNLQPRDGRYVLQVTEPIEEIVYFDEAKLIAVDHPAETQIYPNEMMAISAAPPPFELFCFKDSIEPVSAVDHRGVDVTDRIRASDRSYAGATEIDPRFVGFAEDHFVELNFGDRLQVVSPRFRLILFLAGWVEYPYSATNFAASQAGVSLRAPSVSVFRDGEWIELFKEVGYPAGIRHTMTLDVTGKVLPTDRRIRISSNMELYWDRMFLAQILEESVVGVQEISVASADLHFRGYPREYSPDGHHPNLYDYAQADRAVPWKIMAGDYTRYGDVAELVQEADDCYVIMGRGEELTLSFAADAFGPTPEGCRRTFILKTDSFCKDMDLYSAYPDTVEPLPFHSMSNYPYGADERYPDDKKRREYQRRFNTRRVGADAN